jgi:hypothetical protein
MFDKDRAFVMFHFASPIELKLLALWNMRPKIRQCDTSKKLTSWLKDEAPSKVPKKL